MSSSYYYALWIPQIQKKEPRVICPQLEEKVLCDIEDLSPLYVHGRIILDSYDIVLNYSINKKLLDNELTFNFIKSDDRGFVIYKLDLNDQQTDFLCKRLRKEMPNALYHYFKSFFHRHVFHDDSVDSLLRPYTSSMPIKWENTNVRNEIVERLIADYERKFNGVCKMHSRNYDKIVANLEKRYKIRDMHDEMGRLHEHERNTLNERVYCSFLLKAFPKCIDADRKKQLQETIAHLEALTLKSESSFHKINTSLGLGYSIKGYYIGLGGLFVGLATSVGSLCYTVHQSGNSEEEIKKNIEELQNTVQIKVAELEAEEQSILEQTQQMNSRLDSLTKETNRLQRKLKK